MRVLIYGANGYVGSALVQRLVAAGHAVTGFVRSDVAVAKLQAAGAAAVRGDLDDLTAALAPLQNADVVIMTAWLLLPQEQQAVKAMLDAMAGSGKAFLFTSGTGVLSQRTDGDWSEDTFAEDDPFVPSKYLALRTETETLVRQAATRGIRSMVVRPPMIWGRGGCPQIKTWFQAAVKVGYVPYIGRGLNLYSSVHIDDLAELYKLAIDKGVAGALYHAVSGEVPFRMLAEGVAQAMNVPARSVDFATAEQVWDRFSALILYSVCSRSRSPRARKELGWQPSPDRLDILAETRDADLLARTRGSVPGGDAS